MQLGTTTLPDYRGEFLRGWDNGRGVDPGRGLETSQSDAIRNITGSYASTAYRVSQLKKGDAGVSMNGAFHWITGGGRGHSGWSGSGSAQSGIGFDASRQVPTADENRPRNVAVMYLMRVLP